MSTFSSLKLHPTILDSLKKKGYTTPTPIQAMSIPLLLEGNDMLGIAQTGTGKTAAFSLPILHTLSKQKRRVKPFHMRCLILTPTRELAAQIEDNIQNYGEGLGLTSTVIFGGVSAGPQVRKLKKGLDIVTATPGRLLDLMGEGHFNLSMVETFVLDEADRMLDMGFIHDVKKIIAKLPKERQTLLFSATMPADIVELSNKLLKNPKRVEVTPESTTVEKIDQRICFVEKANKGSLLKVLLDDEAIKQVLVFTRTKHGANRVVQNLEKVGIESAAIHGNKSQGARERALNGFRDGTLRVLVATDIAARGIDVSTITHVINFDLPDDPKSYVHRIGRTARAGRDGVAISFCDPSEKKLLRDIEKSIQYKIPVDENYEAPATTEVASEVNSARPSRSPRPSRQSRPTRSPRSGHSGNSASSERQEPTGQPKKGPRNFNRRRRNKPKQNTGAKND